MLFDGPSLGDFGDLPSSLLSITSPHMTTPQNSSTSTSSSSSTQWQIIYPCYINSTHTLYTGRRIGKSHCVENPTAKEIFDIITSDLGLKAKLEVIFLSSHFFRPNLVILPNGIPNTLVVFLCWSKKTVLQCLKNTQISVRSLLQLEIFSRTNVNEASLQSLNPHRQQFHKNETKREKTKRNDK